MERERSETERGKKQIIDANRNTILTRCTRGFKLKVNDQISQISLIDNIRNMVGINLYFTT